MRTTPWKTAVTVTATALSVAMGAGLAQASAPATAGAQQSSAAPSSCRPANHLGHIAQDTSSAGHSHYRVTLIAAPGYEPCVLAGSPVDVQFSDHGVPSEVTAGRYGAQHMPVLFGPGHPVHFDIQVPDFRPGAPADEATFTLTAPGGEIPGESAASGALRVTRGTLIGPMQPGA